MPGAPGIRSVVILAVLGLVRAAHAAPPHTPQNGVSCTSCHTLRLASRPVHGTVTAAADTTLTAAASWQPGQWVDLTITFTSGPNRGEYRRITGNTATAVTWTPPLFAPLVPGDTFTLGAAAEPTFATRCRSCHNPTGPAAATGRVDVHTVNGGATVIGCGKCHEPHANPPTPAQGQALLRRDLRWGGAAGPVAYPASATNDLIAGQAPYNGICETCHQQTAHHRNNPTADHTHMAPYACPDCHTHETGFASPPSGCSSCHGNPPADPTTLVQSPRATGSTTAGAHERHFQDQSYPCDSCHRDSVGAGTTHGNGKVTVGFSLFGGTYTGGVYDGQTGVAYDGTAGTSVSATGGKTCSQIYCHGQRADGTPWGGGQDTAPRWDGSVTCTSCHDMGGTATALSGRHRTHTNETTYQYPCDQCHNQTALGRSAIKDRSLHANNVKDVALTAGAYDSTAKGCSATTCHTDGRGGPPNVAPTWDAEAPGRCWACHSGTAADSLQMTTNGHDRLVSGHWVRRYPCSHCHSATVDPTTQQVSGATHVNGSVDVKVAPRWNIVGKPAPGYDPATKTCSNVYCHSDGTSVDPRVRTFTWLDQRTECNSCHGHPKGSCQDCHGPTVTGWPPGEEWKAAMPMYVNGGAGATTANTHMRHLLTNFTCDNCHYKTIVNGSCTDCHNAGVPLGSMREVNHIDPAYHVNKVKNVDFKDGGTYDPVTKTCRNTACHTGDDPQWGAAAKDEVLCFNCHGTTSADVDDFNAFNGTRARINMAEWVQTGHGRPTASGPYTSGNPPAAFPGNPCWYCHDNSVLHKDARNPFRLKIHPQYSARFDKECSYCHMQGVDGECRGCHDAASSLAPQLASIASPTDHRGWAGGSTSCVASCHASDATRHKTGAGTWTAAQQADVRNQYAMMGVCLQCHEDDRNNQCQQCHTGAQYRTGYDPGSGFVTATSKATSTHFGYKHWQAFQTSGVWKGGKFCWDCHDPHGDANAYMIQAKVATQTDGTFGVPQQRADVVFTRKQSGLDYARTQPPYNGICNVCHSEPKQHYRFDYGDGHGAGRVCTTCHEHRFSDSHASDQPCTTCHLNKPVPRHDGFGLPRDCTKCHAGVVGDRMDVVGQMKANSHHVQGVKLTNRHCYACHWEATPEGLIDVRYHAGYDYKAHTSVKGAPVDLVTWGPGVRPSTYQLGTTAVTFTASQVGTTGERAEVGNVTRHCVACHSDQNNQTWPFNLVDPQNGDCKSPRQYAWDGTSVAARYQQTGTTTWGKYPTVAGAAPKNVQKAFSAHGNAVANRGGFDPTNGEDAALPNTRNGTQAVQCFDCHSSHGSKTQGVTSSYVTFNGTRNGGNLKETQAGKGGYRVTYRASGQTGGVNPYAAGAGQCFDCHETAAAGTLPWGYQSTFGASAPILGYRDRARFGPGPSGPTTRYAFRSSRAVAGGHLKASAPLASPPMGTIDGLCTPCHDPHGVSPTLGSKQAYAVPLLRGTWLTSPYKEDAPIAVVFENYPGNNPPTPNVYIDQNTFGPGNKVTEDADLFGGLCLRCHPKATLTDGQNHNQPWRSLDRVHEAVKGWGANTQHNYTCSKCHQPHASGLPRLMRTNALDHTHRGRVASGGKPLCQDPGTCARGSYPKGYGYRMQNCHPGTWPDNRWNNRTPW